MAKNFKIAGVLFFICMICAALIAGVNMLTSGIIEKNNEETIKETLTLIYDEADPSMKISTEGKNSSIVEIYEVVAGEKYIYSLAGKNDYGSIKIMAGIEKNADGKFVVGQVEFLENGQSFASTVDAWLKKTFISSPASAVEGGFTTEVVAGSEKYSDLSSVDTKCGATYGANTIKDLLNVALEDAKGGK